MLDLNNMERMRIDTANFEGCGGTTPLSDKPAPQNVAESSQVEDLRLQYIPWRPLVTRYYHREEF